MNRSKFSAARSLCNGILPLKLSNYGTNFGTYSVFIVKRSGKRSPYFLLYQSIPGSTPSWIVNFLNSVKPNKLRMRFLLTWNDMDH